MSQYSNLKAAITTVIKQNDNNEITGNLLQQTLLAIVNSLGVGYQYAGIATPATNPGTPDQNVFYIASTAGTYTNFDGIILGNAEIAILKYNGTWVKDSTGAASIETIDGLLFDSIPFSYVGYALKIDGKLESTSNFSLTDFIPVKSGQRFVVNGLTGSADDWAAVCGYTQPSAGYFVAAIVPGFGRTTRRVEFEIPDGVSYIRASVCNNTDPRFKVAFFGVLATEAIKENVESIQEQTNNNSVAIDMTKAEQYSLVILGTGLFWTTGAPTIVAGNYKITGAIGGITSVQLARELSVATITRAVELENYGNGVYGFDILDSDITAGVAYVRIQCVSGTDSITLARIIEAELINQIVKQIQSQLAAMPNLSGKKIAVIGDSISTIYGKNNPYWVVKSIDVGQQIQSYVTWWDVWANDGGTIPTNKTIGGVTLTEEMIGTLQTFTPVAGDVGKSIGTPLNYNSSGTKVWSEKLCELTGAILLANASWSGSRICSGQTGQWEISEAWNDFTIGCCKVRDDDGNDVVPDIIIVYRGTNDFSHGPISRINDVPLNNGIPATDYINGLYEYRAGYYKTIQKLRTAYPNAYIVCCTLNVFKRGIYDVFPTRNGYYTLPEMNNIIRDIANTMGCGLIEFDKDGITFENCYDGGYITDSETTPTHPNSKGHAVMAQRALVDLKYYLQQ